jgi:hypothetical protein
MESRTDHPHLEDRKTVNIIPANKSLPFISKLIEKLPLKGSSQWLKITD